VSLVPLGHVIVGDGCHIAGYPTERSPVGDHLILRWPGETDCPFFRRCRTMYLAELRARAQNPAPVGIVGVGRMGRGVVDQISTMVGLRVRALADLDGERALRAFTENGWDRDQVCVTDHAGPAPDAPRAGRAGGTGDPPLVPRLRRHAGVGVA